MKYLNNKVQLGVSLSNKVREQTGPINLRPDHVLGVFAAWMVGMLIATFVFFIEVLTKRLKHNKVHVIQSYESAISLAIPGCSNNIN